MGIVDTLLVVYGSILHIACGLWLNFITMLLITDVGGLPVDRCEAVGALNPGDDGSE